MKQLLSHGLQIIRHIAGLPGIPSGRAIRPWRYSCLAVGCLVAALCLAVATASAQPTAHGSDTIWLSTTGLTSLNGSSEPCYVLVAKTPVAGPARARSAEALASTVSGSITYDYQYRSLIDTPVYTRHFQQHTLSADIRMLYKGIYPVNWRFQVRKSNQPLFKDLADINLRFDPFELRRVLEARVKTIIRNRQPVAPDLQRYQALKEKLLTEQDRLQAFTRSPVTIQRLVEIREKAYVNTSIDPLDPQWVMDTPKLSVEDCRLLAEYEQGTKRLAALQPDIRRVEDSLQQARSLAKAALGQTRLPGYGFRPKRLEELIRAYDLPEDSLPAHYKKLLAIRQLSVGRSMINYSELTAKNVSITGVNVAYNPSWYAAAAIGFTDWQFRDFRAVSNRLPRQYLVLGRLGWGDPEKNSVIISYYTGRRNLLGRYNGAGNPGLSSFPISGMSVEGIYHLHPNQQLSLELAKSSYPKYIGPNPASGKPFERNWFTTADRQNEAYSISYKGTFTRTQTGVLGTYRRMGQYFQSYAFYNTPAQQDAWNLQLDQQVRTWMTVRVGLQKNQYRFPMLAGGVKNDIVFKTIQATFHYKRLPVVMAGYYPASQITLVDNAIPVENRFYTLNVSANHSYSALQAFMNTTAVYTRFYNQGSDTGFIYYNAKNLSLTQMAWVGKWNLQASYTAIWQYLGRLDVLEGNTGYNLSETFKLSAGLKYNRLIGVKDVLGYSGGCTVMMRRLGAFQATIDKSYWPGQQKNLIPNTNGHLTFIKTF